MGYDFPGTHGIFPVASLISLFIVIDPSGNILPYLAL